MIKPITKTLLLATLMAQLSAGAAIASYGVNNNNDPSEDNCVSSQVSYRFGDEKVYTYAETNGQVYVKSTKLEEICDFRFGFGNPEKKNKKEIILVAATHEQFTTSAPEALQRAISELKGYRHWKEEGGLRFFYQHGFWDNELYGYYTEWDIAKEETTTDGDGVKYTQPFRWHGNHIVPDEPLCNRNMFRGGRRCHGWEPRGPIGVTAEDVDAYENHLRDVASQINLYVDVNGGYLIHLKK